MVSPAHRRQAAHAVVGRGLCSGRMACRFLRLARATFFYRGRAPSAKQARLAKRLRALSKAHPRYGYRRIAALLRQEGWSVGKRQVQRLRRADGLRVPPTKPQARPPRRLHRLAHQSCASRPRVDVGLRQRRHRARRSTEDAHHPRRVYPLCVMSYARIVPCGPPTCLPGWSAPSKRTVRPLSCAATTGRSSSPRRSSVGWPSSASRPSTSTRAVPGRTASSRASTAASATSASTASSSGRSPKHGSSSRTFALEYNARRPHGKLGYRSPARFAAQLPPLTPASSMDAGQTNPTQLQPDTLQD